MVTSTPLSHHAPVAERSRSHIHRWLTIINRWLTIINRWLTILNWWLSVAEATVAEATYIRWLSVAEATTK